MSGIIANGSMVISDIMVTESGATDPYVIVSFPSRVKVTGVSFTINEYGIGTKGDGLEYQLFCVKGKKALGFEVGEEWDEDISYFFPDGDKPTVICDVNKFLSNTVAPLEDALWYTTNAAYTADVAQMDTDEYLTLWVENTAGDFASIIDPDAVRATVTISYTGATNID